MERKLVHIMFENTSDGIIITDANLKIMLVNPAFTKVTGYAKEEAVGKTPKLLKSGIHHKEFYIALWTSIGRYGFWEGEIWNKKKNGDIYNEWLKISALRDNKGTITNFIGVFKDISETEKMKKDLIQTGILQRNLLPKKFNNRFLVTRSLYKPKRYVSGDFYNYTWNVGQKRFTGYVIDFMGHGLATALQTSTIRILFHQLFKTNGNLSEKVALFNNELMHYVTEDSFAAAIFYDMDFTNNTMTICSGGINYFLFVRNNETYVHQVQGSFLGLYENMEFTELVFPLKEGDEYYFFSDGISDQLEGDFHFSQFTFNDRVQFIKELAHSDRAMDDASGLFLKVLHLNKGFAKKIEQVEIDHSIMKE